MNYFDSNRCSESMHVFLRDDDNHINAYHITGSDIYALCGAAEFDFADMLDGDVDRVIECPWCLQKPVEQGHIRRCSNYKPAYTEDEIRDAYSHPADGAKRDAMLKSLAE